MTIPSMPFSFGLPSGAGFSNYDAKQLAHTLANKVQNDWTTGAYTLTVQHTTDLYKVEVELQPRRRLQGGKMPSCRIRASVSSFCRSGRGVGYSPADWSHEGSASESIRAGWTREKLVERIMEVLRSTTVLDTVAGAACVTSLDRQYQLLAVHNPGLLAQWNAWCAAQSIPSDVGSMYSYHAQGAWSAFQGFVGAMGGKLYAPIDPAQVFGRLAGFAKAVGEVAEYQLKVAEAMGQVAPRPQTEPSREERAWCVQTSPGAWWLHVGGGTTRRPEEAHVYTYAEAERGLRQMGWEGSGKYIKPHPAWKPAPVFQTAPGSTSDCFDLDGAVAAPVVGAAPAVAPAGLDLDVFDLGGAA